MNRNRVNAEYLMPLVQCEVNKVATRYIRHTKRIQYKKEDIYLTQVRGAKTNHQEIYATGMMTNKRFQARFVYCV